MSESNLSRSPESLVREVISRWRSGERPDARSFLEAHPEVQQRKTLAIDLIYEEFCLRQEQGETCVASTFCNRFPAYKQSLARMLDVHQFMAGAEESATPRWPEIGSEFLGFEIVEQIGAGAVAKVYLARETEVGGRLVVIKVSRFGRGEARLLGKLTHPGVVPIHSVKDDPQTGMTCICMPFLGTATLMDVLDEAFPLGMPPTSAEIIGRLALGYLPAGIDPAVWGRVDPFFSGASYVEGIVHLGRQIVSALAKAHQAGIAHRDIKPSNVLLARDGRPMLLDFNLSTQEALPADRVGGTLAYMPPEQLEAIHGPLGEAERASDPRSDLYSVGVMLYELLTGKLPSRTLERPGKPPAISDWIECRRGLPRPASQLNPEVEPALDAILLRTLAPRPLDRFQSADELAAALDVLLAPRVRLGRKIRRRRKWIFAGAALLATAGAAGGWYAWNLPPLPERLYQRGLRAFDREDFKAAEELFTRSIKEGNDTMEVYFARAQTRRQLGDWEGEIVDFSNVGQRDQVTGIALIYAADTAIRTERHLEALAMLRQAQVAGWNTVKVGNALGIAFSRTAFADQGLQQFERILAEYPDYEIAKYNRILWWQQHTDGASQVMPPPAIIDEALALAQADPDNVKIVHAAALLLCNAARLGNQDFYRVQAQGLLVTAEGLGIPRSETLPWWRQLTDNIPPPKTRSRALDQKERATWRQTPPPTDPRLDVCLQSLRLDSRLSPP